MNDRAPAELEATVRRLLADIAPDADIDALSLDADMRDHLDLDSVDFLNFVTALAEETGVEVPERDYSAIATVAGCTAYVHTHR